MDEATAREVGELRFRTQAERRADRIARDAMLGAGRVAPDERLDATVPFGAQRADAGGRRHAALAVARGVPETFRERGWCGREPGELRDLGSERRRIERSDDLHAGLRVLMHDERQQRSGADERDALADRDALRLERDLRAAEGGDAGQRPARKRQHAVHRAGGEQQAVERDLAVTIAREHVEAVAEDVPHQRARSVVDAAGTSSTRWIASALRASKP
jgi:hypothetical protein